MIKEDKNKIKLPYTYIPCRNCNGYGAKGREPHRIICPSCEGTGILRINLSSKTRKTEDQV